MVRIWIWLIICVFSVACAMSRPSGRDLSGMIAGRVTDEVGEPIPGVDVIINHLNLGAATGWDGYYCMKDVPAGKYRISADAIGYGSMYVDDLTVKSGRISVQDFNLVSGEEWGDQYVRADGKIVDHYSACDE